MESPLSNQTRQPVRVLIRRGDVFAVPLDEFWKKYFQYVADDTTQLNSRVIRAFELAYPTEAEPNLVSVVQGTVAFHAHVVIRWGLQMGLWEKVGNAKPTTPVDVWFRNSNDYGEPSIKVSEDWYVWKINEPAREIGPLLGEYREAEIGVVVTPSDIVDRMRTGKYHFVYPKF